MKILSKVFLLALLIVGFVACDDAEPEPAKGSFTVTIENILTPKNYLASGEISGLTAPGEEKTFTFNAGKGMYLSFSTMFVQSNDLFYGFADTGLALYDSDGNAITGDVTAEVDLWDAGTEVNEMPGTGMNQPPRQGDPNTGMTENGTVQIVNDAFTYPTNSDVIQVLLAHNGGTEFIVTIKNISGSSTLPTPFAPGVWAIHPSGVKMFTDGTTASAGLEALAEDGNNAMMLEGIASNTGYASPFAPGVWAVHNQGVTPIFTANEADRAAGLEALAEDGDPATLATAVEALTGVSNSGVFNTPDGASAAGPLMPSNTYSFTFDAEDGDYLSLATMLVHTNDLFYAFKGTGIPLFENGTAISGDVTGSLELWDAGTEINEYPGAGNYQPARGGAASGPAESGVVKIVDDSFVYPANSDAIKVTISVQ